MSDINPDEIQLVNVLKGPKAVEKYGEKGKNGVVEITLKNFREDHSMTITSVQQLRKRLAKSIIYPKKAQEKGETGEVKDLEL